MGNDKNTAADSSWQGLTARFGSIFDQYASVLGVKTISDAFEDAGAASLANLPSLQNRRVKAISPLPRDYTKEEIGEFLRVPYSSEKPLGQVAETLKYTSYPWFKIVKTYADIGTYRHYIKPLYYDGKDKDARRREEILLDKFVKTLRPKECAHKIVGQAMISGKVFYYPRYKVDKSHNAVECAFLQQLPQEWTQIIGFNNISGYTVSFNLMYFMQAGTDYTQFGDLFTPYMADFENAFDVDEPKKKRGFKYYAKTGAPHQIGLFNIDKVNRNGVGNPRVFMQNGRWMYYVSLPINKVWTHEIDDTSAACVSPLAGLMLTAAQQSDYEAAQLALLVSPLVKIFTGEIPYYDERTGQKEDGYRLSKNGYWLFSSIFEQLMQRNNTGGTAFFMAPVENIKSHDFQESANANEISTTFNRYEIEKAGLAGILPATNDPKAGLAELSAKLESKYTQCVYNSFNRMMNYIISDLGLKYEWEFKMFGSIYDEENVRQKAEKAISNGDISAHYILSALDDESFIDKMSMCRAVNDSGMLDLLIPPVTSYTMKQKYSGLPPRASTDEGGRPPKSADDMADGVDGVSDNDHTIDYKGG